VPMGHIIWPIFYWIYSMDHTVWHTLKVRILCKGFNSFFKISLKYLHLWWLLDPYCLPFLSPFLHSSVIIPMVKKNNLSMIKFIYWLLFINKNKLFLFLARMTTWDFLVIFSSRFGEPRVYPIKWKGMKRKSSREKGKTLNI